MKKDDDIIITNTAQTFARSECHEDNITLPRGTEQLRLFLYRGNMYEQRKSNKTESETALRIQDLPFDFQIDTDASAGLYRDHRRRGGGVPAYDGPARRGF